MWWCILLLLPAAVLLWLGYEWLEHTMVQYTTTEIECGGLSEQQQIKLCLISDLHNNKKNLSRVMERIREFSPELVLLAGDMVDKHKQENRHAEEFITVLSALKCPVYYSVGNHEASMMKKQPKAWKMYLRRIEGNVCILDNRSVCMNTTAAVRAAVSGLSLPGIYYKKGSLYEGREELPEFFVPDHEIHILMAHNPEYAALYDGYHADLIVSGHLHGGLLRLPFIGGVVSPRLRMTDKDAGLVHLPDGSSLFISRGLGSHTVPLRFFNRVEVNFLILKGTGAKK